MKTHSETNIRKIILSLSSLQFENPVVSTTGVPSKFSTPSRPLDCSPEFPDRMAAGGKTD